jgi:hypothetical protein
VTGSTPRSLRSDRVMVGAISNRLSVRTSGKNRLISTGASNLSMFLPPHRAETIVPVAMRMADTLDDL